jgi:hypothetical protein
VPEDIELDRVIVLGDVVRADITVEWNTVLQSGNVVTACGPRSGRATTSG